MASFIFLVALLIVLLGSVCILFFIIVGYFFCYWRYSIINAGTVLNDFWVFDPAHPENLWTKLVDNIASYNKPGMPFFFKKKKNRYKIKSHSYC